MNSIKCCTSSEIPANPASCFAPPALKNATTAQNVDGRRAGPFSRDFLIMLLLKFACKLLKLPSESLKYVPNCNQTDENQVEQSCSNDYGFNVKKTHLADVGELTCFPCLFLFLYFYSFVFYFYFTFFHYTYG